MRARTNKVNFRHGPAHVSLHRLWAFANHRRTMESSVDGHVKNCPECRLALQACLQEKSFGAVLKFLKQNHENADESQERPKLGNLYVFTGRIE